MRRQAGVMVFRQIYPQYSVPLGVWVVRETARAAFRNRNRPEKFDTKSEALKYINSRLRLRAKEKEGITLDIKDFEPLSRILRQKRLTDF